MSRGFLHNRYQQGEIIVEETKPVLPVIEERDDTEGDALVGAGTQPLHRRISRKLPCKHCGIVGCMLEWWAHPLPHGARVKYRKHKDMVYFVVYTYKNSIVSVLKISNPHTYKAAAIAEYVGYVRPILGDNSDK